MEDQFVNFDIALALKELGFDEPCMMCFIDEQYKYQHDLHFSSDMGSGALDRYTFKKNSDFSYSTSAPLWQQVIDWLRDKKNMLLFVKMDDNSKYFCEIQSVTGRSQFHSPHWSEFDYFQARKRGIEEAIKLLSTSNLWNAQKQVNLSK